MVSSATSISSNNQGPAYHPFRGCFSEGAKKVRRILDQHTDSISSIGILVVTTGILASKIFSSMPKIIGNSGRLFLEFSGIIWLNVQVKEFVKSQRDGMLAIRNLEYGAILRTILKVIIKAINILLTCAYFGASITTFGGWTHCSSAIYMGLRPLSLAILSAEIINEIGDYMTNRKLLKRFEAIEHGDHAGRRLASVMCSFLQINLESRRQQHIPKIEIDINDKKLSSCIVRQLDTFTLEMLRENIASQKDCMDPRMKALNLYYNIKEGLGNTQARVASNLSLTALGYISRGICKMYPDSLKEMLARWSMSVLFTDELVIKYKLRQSDLALR